MGGNKLMLIKYRNIILIICLIYIQQLSGQNLNLLENFQYLTDKCCKNLILKFNYNPICLSEPKINKESITFFLPLTLVNNKNLIKLNSLNELNEINFKFEVVDKPLKGIKIILTYDQSKITWKIDRLDKIISFKFFDKNFLKELTEKESENYLYI